MLSSSLFAQEGTVSGTLKDKEGFPIPGVNIIIKGTSKGVTSDFDGNYRISCNVGDVLQFNFIGYKTSEVIVTAKMFEKQLNKFSIKRQPIKTIKSEAYIQAIKNTNQPTFSIPSLIDSKRTYNRSSYFQYNRIKSINVEKDKVKLTYFDPDIFFEVGLKTINGLQFVKNSNLPQLQNIYSQGISNNGSFEFQGPETGTAFSFGPRLNLLEFDGLSYAYDINGKLVGINTGNGNQAKAYNNSIFNSSVNTSHHAFMDISTNDRSLRFDFTNRTQKDLYDVERSRTNNIQLKYAEKSNYKYMTWKAFLKYNHQINNQPNINGFLNNLLLNAWATPPSFSNTQGASLLDNTQRSFSPNLFNNPEWLLQYNRNSEKQSHFVSGLNNKITISDALSFNTKLNYSHFKNIQNFGVVKHTNGFGDGYLSKRFVDKHNFNAMTNFNWKVNIDESKIDFSSSTDFLHETLKYELSQAEGFDAFSFDDAQTTSRNQRQLHRNLLRLQNKVTFKSRHEKLVVGLSNNSYVSSIQNNKWVLPTLQAKLNLDRLIDIYDFHNVYISAGASYDVNETPLIYGNLSHNSLNIRPEESLNYLATNDLFVDQAVKLEEKESFDINLGFRFWTLGSHFDVDFTHFTNNTKNAVFPIFENNSFQLKNVADIKNSGIEANFSAYINFSQNFKYHPKFTFSTYRPRVTKLHGELDRIPIAGFSSISKQLIVGQPTGVIVGSAYAKDNNNNILIGNDGFPLVDSEPQIIGNPIPKFNIGFNSHIELHNFTLNFLIDFQKGGDVWNGTQNVLNYFGTSQQSANERNISNFVFQGVDNQGNINTMPVDFYNPENSFLDNRFVRYGFEGVAQDAIVDGSYINLKSIELTYTFKHNTHNEFLRTFEVGLYANNLITWTKFKGASPYSKLYDSSSAGGLNFFNAPLISEVGLKINLKI